MMHLALRGISRDQFMARHKANHIQVVYAPTEAAARRALFAKAAAMQELGIAVAFCGTLRNGGGAVDRSEQAVEKRSSSVTPAKAGVQNCPERLDFGVQLE